MTFRKNLLIGIFCTLTKWVDAQPTTEGLGVKAYDSYDLPSLLGDLDKAKEDTAKIELLLKISSKYHLRGLKLTLDSALIYSRKAALLSKSLKYTQGYNEATFLTCKSLLNKKDFDAAKQVLQEVRGEQYIRLLLVLTEFYINDKDASPKVLRTAAPYLEKANSLSARYQSRHWITESSIVEAKYHFRLGEITKGTNCFKRVIREYEKIDDKAAQAHWWQELGRYMPDMDSTYAIQITAYSRAAALFRAVGNKEEEAESEYLEAFVHSCHNRPDLAERLYLLSMKKLQAAKVKKFYRHYQVISRFYQQQGNLGEALRYALESLDNLNSHKDSSQLIRLYLYIGNVYASMGDFNNSVKYYQKLALSERLLHGQPTYGYLKLLIDAQIRVGKAAEGLQFLKSFLKTIKSPDLAFHKQLVAAMLGDCYVALKDFKKAEQYYLEMIRLNKQVESSEQFYWINHKSVAGAEAYLTIGRFYSATGKFDLADHYLRTALVSKGLTPEFEMDCRRLIFKVDSTNGNYFASIRNYQRYVLIKDSIARAIKDKDFSILKANFKTIQKENENKLLQKEALLQKRQLEFSARTEKFTYAGLAALFCLLGLLYNGYRLKQNKNLQLEEQQKTINIKNSSLIRLVNEKEWLLKEVHHRVKNNLQIVISLLNSQSAYLKEDVAVNAILESRHRIQAMSMLHQRIYQSQNMSGIAMPSYIHELVYYLDNSFHLGKRIIFNVNVEDIELDLVQAVPVGLILNEAITNSLKYAFPNQREGEIKISLNKIDDLTLLLSIADDGIGLCQDFNMEEIKSFGLKLIKGLTEDLEGDFTVIGQPGTTLLIEFDYKSVIGIHHEGLLEVQN